MRLGLNQLKRLNNYVKIRHKIAEYYNSKLRKFPITLPFQAQNTYSSYHLYPIRVKKNLTGKSQKKIYNSLLKKSIAVNILYIPVHRQPFYEDLGFKKNDFPEAEKFHNEVICLPMYPTLNDDQKNIIIKSIETVLNNK